LNCAAILILLSFGLTLARTTESIFHQTIINVLVSCDKGPFEKCRNAIFSDFDANWRKISKFVKNIFSKSTFEVYFLEVQPNFDPL